MAYGFNVVQGQPDLKMVWRNIDTAATSTLYVGQLEKTFSATGAINGAAPLAQASGLADNSGGQIIDGIVIGFNTYPMAETFDSIYGQSMVYEATAAAQLAVPKMGNEGMDVKGDPGAKTLCALLNSASVIEGPICSTTPGTNIPVLTATGTPSTTAITVNACQFTPTTANLSTTYCRTGINAGIYRVNADTSTTSMTFTEAWPKTPAAGDTFVRVPLHKGTCMAQINGTSGIIGVAIDGAAAPATNYFLINVHSLHLGTAGKEKVVFSFNPIHFATRLTS